MVKLPQRVALVTPYLATQWNSHDLIHFRLLLSKDKCGPTKGNEIVLNTDQMDKIMEILDEYWVAKSIMSIVEVMLLWYN